MKIILYGRRESINKINHFIQFDYLQIFVFDEMKYNYVNINFAEADCIFLCTNNFESVCNIIKQISTCDNVVKTIVLDKFLFTNKRQTEVLFSLKSNKIQYSLNINRMYDLSYMNDFYSKISTSQLQEINIILGKNLYEYAWIYSVVPPIIYNEDKILDFIISVNKSNVIIKTENKVYIIKIEIGENSASISINVNGEEVITPNYYESIINCINKKLEYNLLFNTATSLSKIVEDFYEKKNI